MLNKLSSILFLILLASIVYIVCFYDVAFNFRNNQTNQPDFIFENIVVSHFNDEKLESEFKSNKAQIYRQDNKIFLFETKGAFFLDDLNTIWFNSSNLTYDLDTFSIKMENPYLVYFGDNPPVWLSSRKLNYNVKDKIINSNSLTNLYFLDGFVESKEVVFNLSKYKILLEGHPRFDLKLPYE